MNYPRNFSISTFILTTFVIRTVSPKNQQLPLLERTTQLTEAIDLSIELRDRRFLITNYLHCVADYDYFKKHLVDTNLVNDVLTCVLESTFTTPTEDYKNLARLLYAKGKGVRIQSERELSSLLANMAEVFDLTYPRPPLESKAPAAGTRIDSRTGVYDGSALNPPSNDNVYAGTVARDNKFVLMTQNVKSLQNATRLL